MPIRNRFAEWLPELTAWRRDLHQHPEIQFDTHRTAALVAERLTAFGCDEVVTGVARSGVVGIIRGKSNTSGKVIGLRADMDALPMTEETGLAHASKVAGAMHACGHDGHTTMLLGAARYLAENRNFDGTVALLFQPAEEGGGGAEVMVGEGVLDRWNIEEVYGMHNWPGLPVGQFSIRPGPFFAAADQFDIEVEGKGAHAAKPHTGIDPTVVASQIVMALQTIASRNVDPVEQVVLSVTSFETETTAYNIIPQRVRLKGTVRTLSGDVRTQVQSRLTELAERTAAAFGAVARVSYNLGYPVMTNSEPHTEFAARAARTVAGGCADAPLIMGAEDFAYMLDARQGAYILIGNGDTANVHHPQYDFADEAIPAGCSWWAELVEQRLPLG